MSGQEPLRDIEVANEANLPNPAANGDNTAVVE